MASRKSPLTKPGPVRYSSPVLPRTPEFTLSTRNCHCLFTCHYLPLDYQSLVARTVCGLLPITSSVPRAERRVEVQRLWNECLSEQEGEPGFRTTGFAWYVHEHNLYLLFSLGSPIPLQLPPRLRKKMAKGREISVQRHNGKTRSEIRYMVSLLSVRSLIQSLIMGFFY